MKYYIIAGEASGDLHGCNLIKQLHLADTSADIRCWGGDLMEQAGATLVKHYRETAYMGLFEVIKHAGTIAKNFKFCYSDISSFKPDVIILIDYPGFNLRVARFAKEKGIKVFYYISPKVWVWNEKRVKSIKAFVDKMFVIFPFEKDWYFNKHQFNVDFIGNPLLDAIEEKRKSFQSKEKFLAENNLNEQPIVAMLPGSRNHEIERLLPIMVETAKKFNGYQFVVAGTTALPQSLYQKYISDSGIKIIYNKTYELLANAKAAIVTSGTATLETALFSVPQVVCYKISNATYLVGKPFVYVKYFSLVNIIMDELVVKELLQFNLVRDVSAELKNILENTEYYQKMLAGYARLNEKCGGPGASERAAKLMVSYLKNPAN